MLHAIDVTGDPLVPGQFGVPQPAKWHPEIDCGVHTMMVIEQAALLSDDGEVRFAALVHDLGKATTAKSDLPKHPGHEHRSVRLVKKMSDRLPLPKPYTDLALLVAEFHGHCHRALELRASTVLKVLERVDAFRRPERFQKFLHACEADARGRTGLEQRDYPQAQYLRDAFSAASQIKPAEIADDSLSGAEIGDKLHRERLRAIKAFKQSFGQLPKV